MFFGYVALKCIEYLLEKKLIFVGNYLILLFN